MRIGDSHVLVYVHFGMYIFTNGDGDLGSAINPNYDLGNPFVVVDSEMECKRKIFPIRRRAQSKGKSLGG